MPRNSASKRVTQPNGNRLMMIAAESSSRLSTRPRKRAAHTNTREPLRGRDESITGRNLPHAAPRLKISYKGPHERGHAHRNRQHGRDRGPVGPLLGSANRAFAPPLQH